MWPKKRKAEAVVREHERTVEQLDQSLRAIDELLLKQKANIERVRVVVKEKDRG